MLFFLEILLTIKRRNPVYRERIINHYKEYVASDQFKKDVGIGIEISRRIDKIDPEEYLKNYIEEVTISKDKQSDMYLQGFLDIDNKTAKNAAQTLLQYKLFIYHASFGSEFITSDNPGFTLLTDNQLLSFGGFGLPFKFIFPLTPKCCLFITHRDVEKNNLLLAKDIYVINVDKNVVDAINSCTYQIAREKVFSYSKNTLLNLTNK